MLPGWASEWWEKKNLQRLKSSCCTLIGEATQRNPEMLQMFWVCPATSCWKCMRKAAAWFAVQNTLIISFIAANVQKQSFKLLLSMSRLKRRKKSVQLSSFYYWSTSFEHLLSLGGGWEGEPKNDVSFKSSHFWTEGDFHLVRVKKKFPGLGSPGSPPVGCGVWASSSQCWSGL